jgi:2-dehydropantoate 2-reductase
VLHAPGMSDLALGLMRECLAVGRAEGAELPDSLPDEILARLLAAPRSAGNSMLYDRRAGRRLETDARNGAVVRLGARHGIATPLNAAVCALLDASVDCAAGGER